MRYNDYLNFNFRQIKEFLVLCEDLNYTQAAKKCFITQSTLTRNIQNLESTLGIQLFIRNTVKVTPTPAGRQLYDQFKSIFEQYENAIMNAYKIQEGKSHPIKIILNDGMDIMPELFPFIQYFSKIHPNFEISISRDYDYTLNNALQTQECDIILDFEGIKQKNDFVKSVVLTRTPLMLYMLKTNPLARKRKLTLQDLTSQQLLVRSPSKGSNNVDFLRQIFTSLGVEPNFSVYTNNAIDMTLNLLHDNQSVLADKFFVGRHIPYLVGKPIQDTESIIYARYLKHHDNNSDTQIFINDLVEYLKKIK